MISHRVQVDSIIELLFRWDAMHIFFPRPEWNLIGVDGTDPVSLEEFFALDLSKVSYVYGFDNTLKEYTYWIAGVGGTLATLQPGEGH